MSKRFSGISVTQVNQYTFLRAWSMQFIRPCSFIKDLQLCRHLFRAPASIKLQRGDDVEVGIRTRQRANRSWTDSFSSHYRQILCLSVWCILSFPVETKNKCFYCCRLIEMWGPSVTPSDHQARLCALISNHTFAQQFMVLQLKEKNFWVGLKAIISSTSEPRTRLTTSNIGTCAMTLDFLCKWNANFWKANAINWGPLSLSVKEQFSQQFSQQLCYHLWKWCLIIVHA